MQNFDGMEDELDLQAEIINEALAEASPEGEMEREDIRELEGGAGIDDLSQAGYPEQLEDDELPEEEGASAAPVFEFYAPAARGLEELLADEVRNLGVRDLRPLKTGLTFYGTLEDAYKVLLWSRLASRVEVILAYIDSRDSDDLYRSVRSIPWERHFDLESTFAVDARGMNPNLRNTQFTALRVKDAICDRFRERFGARPSVSKKPDIRIDVSVHGNRATVSLDLAGSSLHHRSQGGAAMKGGASARESLAAGALVHAGWADIAKAGGPFVDPMCGSGALVVEAAMVACDMAPGILRPRWGFTAWKMHDEQTWDRLLAEADDRVEAGRSVCPPIVAIDANPTAVDTARRAARGLGLEDLIDFRVATLADLEELELPEAPVDPETGEPIGLVATVPPTGRDAISAAQRPALWAVLGERVRARFSGWRFALVTGDGTVDAPLGLRASATHLLPDGREDSAVRLYTVFDDPTMRLTLSNGTTVFASEPGTGQFADRLAKMRDHRAKWARHTGVGCYRVYDADLPDYNVAIDVYQGAGPDEGKTWAVVSEYAAPAEVDPARAAARLADALAVIPPTLGLEPESVFLKVRRRAKGGSQYADSEHAGVTGVVSENGLLFEVNFSDYLDTGLFLDHRDTRAMVGEMAAGKRFLNLFAYTGTATAHAIAAGAESTTTVDLSSTYLSWARRNLELNGFDTTDEGPNALVKADVMGWISQQRRARNRWDLIFVDPPTFSNSSEAADWDVEKMHAELLIGCSRLLTRNGQIVFSCNKRGFSPDLGALRKGGVRIEEITPRTIPADFERNPRIHSCFIATREIADDERAHLFGDSAAASRVERFERDRAEARKRARSGRRDDRGPRRDDHRDGGRGYDRPRRDGERGFDRPRRDDRRDGERSFDRRPGTSGDRRFGDDRPRRDDRRDGSRGYDRPRRDDRRDGERSFDRRPGTSGDRRFGDDRRDGNRSYDRPRRDGERSFDRSRRDGEHSYDRSRRDDRRDNERSFDRRPGTSGDRRFGDDRPRRDDRRDGGRGYDRPRRDGERGFDRPRRDDRRDDRGPRRDGERSYGHRDDRAQRQNGSSRPGFRPMREINASGPRPAGERYRGRLEGTETQGKRGHRDDRGPARGARQQAPRDDAYGRGYDARRDDPAPRDDEPRRHVRPRDLERRPFHRDGDADQS